MILLVDDNPDIRRALVMLLKHYGYEVYAVDSGRRALEAMECGLPHCVLLDYNMPEMNGLDVLRKIRANPRLEEVRVILFTAQDGALRQEALAAGADDFVAKGTLDFAELERAVRRHCEPPRRPQPFVTPSPPPEKVVG